MNQGLALSDVGCGGSLLVYVESRPGLTKARGCLSAAQLVLRETDALVRGDRNTPVGAAVSGIVAALDPDLRNEVEDVDIVQPDVREVLATYDEKAVGGHGREVCVASIREEGRIRRDGGSGQPVPG